jgi:hypothetical protein
MAKVKPINVAIIINEKEAFDLFQLLEVSECKLNKAGLPNKNLSLYEELGRTFNFNGILPVGMPEGARAEITESPKTIG